MLKTKISVRVNEISMKDATDFLSEKIEGINHSLFEVEVVVVKEKGSDENNPEMGKFSDLCFKLGAKCKTVFSDDKNVLDETEHDYPSKRKSPSSRGSSVERGGSIYKSNFEEIQKLGKGGYGKVFLCKNKLDGIQYAVKQIPCSDSQYSKFSREPTHLAKLSHHNIVRYHFSWIEDWATPLSEESEEYNTGDFDVEISLSPLTKTLFIVMEYCTGSLSTKIEGGLTREEAYGLIRQMLEGMMAMHSIGIVHRDVSKHNMLIGQDGLLKYTDLGLAIQYEDAGNLHDASNRSGQAAYRSPEMMGESPKVCALSDIFSLGLIIFEMVNPMKSAMERCVSFDKIRAGTFDWEESGLNRKFFEMFLATDPTERMSAADILGGFPYLRVWTDEILKVQ